MKSEKKNKKNKNAESEIITATNTDEENLRLEVEKFIQGAEEAMKNSDFEPEAELKLKEKQKTREILFREIIADRNYDNLLNFMLKKIKNVTDCELMQMQHTSIIEELTKNNEILLEINEKEKNRLITFTNYSKNLLARVKVLNEEKLKIDREEKQKKLEIEKKCEDFKKDVCEKFNSNFPELEKLKAENAALRQRFEKLKSKFEVQLNNIITENKKETISNAPNATSKKIFKERKKKIEIYLENLLNEDCEGLETSIQSLLENDKDFFLQQISESMDAEGNSEDESYLRLKNKFNYILQIRELMQENEKMKQENTEINEEISRIKAESENADIDLIRARQAFEQGRLENIKLNQEIEYMVKENDHLKEYDFEIIVAEADEDMKTLKDKIAHREKENQFLAEKLEKLIELKIEMEQKKEENENADECYSSSKKD